MWKYFYQGQTDAIKYVAVLIEGQNTERQRGWGEGYPRYGKNSQEEVREQQADIGDSR